MPGGADQKAPGVGGQEDNIVNEQPIEISSESSNDGMGDGDGESYGSDEESELAVSVATSLSDSSESHEDHKLEDEFDAILAMPSKEYKQYMALCHTAFKLNVFEKIELAINEFEKNATIPPHIWLRYLKTLQAVTQTPAEREIFDRKCALALASYYDEQLAEFVFRSLVASPAEKQQIWVKLLADYGLDRLDFIKKLRELLSAIEDKNQAEQLERTISAKCVTWNCNETELEEIEQLIEEFKQKLKNSSQYTSWLQENFIAKADALPLGQNIKCTLGKLVFEGCLAKFPTDDTVWLDYIAYMQTIHKDLEDEVPYHTLLHDGYLKSKPLELIDRALQAKPSARLNHKFLQLLEHYDHSLDSIDTQLSRVFERIEKNIEMSVELHLDYLAYRVRNADVTNDEQVEDLRNAFRRTWDRLSEQYGELADTNYEVLQLWALVEYSHLNCPSSGAAIWGEILSYAGNSAKSHLWMAYAQMEYQYNEGRKMNSVLKQALMTRQTAAQQLTELYRRHERCFGDYASIAECQSHCETYYREYDEPEYNHLAPAWQRGHRATQQLQSGRRQPTGNRKQLSQLPPLAPKPKPPPPASTAKTDTQKLADPKGSNFKYSTQMEANKIFIKNLYLQCQKEELHSAFQGFGTIKDIRMVYKLNNRFKGIAFIEYELPEEADRAVAGGNDLEIGGQKIVVAISNPPPKPAPGTGTSAAAAGTGAAAAPRPGDKRRIPTSLIPTRLMMLDVKRRKKLELNDEEADGAATSSGQQQDSNGKCNDANGKETIAATDQAASSAAAPEGVDPIAPPAVAPKTNDDFRKLFEK